MSLASMDSAENVRVLRAIRKNSKVIHFPRLHHFPKKVAICDPMSDDFFIRQYFLSGSKMLDSKRLRDLP